MAAGGRVMAGTQRLSWSYRVKRSVVSTSLLTLGVTFEAASRHSVELKRELAEWEEGRTLSLGVLPFGPRMTVRKEGDSLRYLGRAEQPADLKILFKNMDAAFLVLTAQLGSPDAFAQHRMIVHGNLAHAMQANRAMAIVQKFLFPSFLLRRLMKRPPTFTAGELLLKVRLSAGLVPALILNWSK